MVAMLFASLFFGLFNSYAGGNESAQGGDGKAIELERIKLDLQKLKIKVSMVLGKTNLNTINKEWYRDTWQLFSQKEALQSDVTNTEYIIAEPGSPEKPAQCFDKDGIRQHSSTRSEKGAPICFDLQKIAEDRLSTAQIVALAFHEHGHHFGFDEAAANQIGAYMEVLYPQYAQFVIKEEQVSTFVASLPDPLRYYFLALHDADYPESTKIAFIRNPDPPLSDEKNFYRLLSEGISLKGLVYEGLGHESANRPYENERMISFDVNSNAFQNGVMSQGDYISPFFHDDLPIIELMQWNYEHGFIQMRAGFSLIKAISEHFEVSCDFNDRGANYKFQLSNFWEAFNGFDGEAQALIKQKLKKIIFSQHHPWFWQKKVEKLTLNRNNYGNYAMLLQFVTDDHGNEGKSVTIEEIQKALREIMAE